MRLIISELDARLLTTPMNVAVIADERWIPMSCGTDGASKVRLRSKYKNACLDEKVDEFYDISSGSRIRAECVNKSYMMNHTVGGQYELLVKAEVGNANTYACNEPGSRNSSSAEFTVLSMISLLAFVCMSLFYVFKCENFV